MKYLSFNNNNKENFVRTRFDYEMDNALQYLK